MTARAKSPRIKLLAQLAIARRDLGLQESDYRDHMFRVTGERSAKQLDENGLNALLESFKKSGWKQGKGGDFKPSEKAYVRKIYAIWGQLKRDGVWRDQSKESLRKFIEAQTNVSQPEWLTYPQASRVIEALKQMGGRA